jgi:hypothetical protein
MDLTVNHGGKMELNQGQNVKIEGNEILGIMGIPVATGEVVHVRDNGFSFKCKETGAIETADFGDGELTILD